MSTNEHSRNAAWFCRTCAYAVPRFTRSKVSTVNVGARVQTDVRTSGVHFWNQGGDFGNLIGADNAVVHAIFVELPFGLPAIERADGERLVVVHAAGDRADVKRISLLYPVDVHEDPVALSVEDKCVVRPRAEKVSRA